MGPADWHSHLLDWARVRPHTPLRAILQHIESQGGTVTVDYKVGDSMQTVEVKATVVLVDPDSGTQDILSVGGTTSRAVADRVTAHIIAFKQAGAT